MRIPADIPPRQPRFSAARSRLVGKGRIILLVLLGLVAVVFLSARSWSGFYVDYLWFESLGRADVFWTTLGAKLTVVVLFTAGFAVAAFVNMLVADRLRPAQIPFGPEGQVLQRYRELVGSRTGLVRTGVAGLLGLFMGVPAVSQWQEWLLFRNAQSFGVDDPLFGADVGFYVFRLPFLTYLVDWLFAAFILVAIVTSATHYVNGAIRIQGVGERITRPARIHLSILFALIAVLKAADYWLQRFELTVSTRGVVHGATYTDVNAQLPAYNLLILVSLLVAGLFLAGTRIGGWRLPVLAVASWAVVAVVAGAIYPAVVQRFVVQPNVTTRERPYIEDHLVATKAAMGIDNVEVLPLSVERLTTQEVEEDAAPLRDVRLLEPGQMRDRFSLDEGLLAFYAITDLDVDRYVIDGREQQVMLAARELNPAGVPNKTWVSQHLIYTHGCGLVAAPASRVTADGRPVYADLQVERPELYVGQGLGTYAIVRTEQAEQACPGVEPQPYLADAGVRLNSIIRRIAFAINFGEYNLFGSRLITDDSRIIYVRDVRDRVQKLAPFLHLDADPYPVAHDGRVVWVVDAFTTTARYPYSQRANTDQLTPGSGLNHRFNYVRNSVKAVVDGYTGDVTLYLVDPSDPIARAWSRAYPGLFTPASEVPDDLRKHFRYPEDLFRVQTNLYGRYQFDNADQFFNRDAAWSVAQAPSEEPEAANPPVPSAAQEPSRDIATQADTGEVAEANVARFEPYYTIFHPPGTGGDRPRFSLLRPFVPFSSDDTRKELRGLMVASSDPESYGKLTVYSVTSPLPPGPATVAAELESNPDISPIITQLDLRGSRVIFGDLQVVLVADGIVWVRPLYVRPDDEGSKQVFVRQVMALHDNRSVIGDTLSGAISRLFPGFGVDLGDVVNVDGTPVEPSTPTDSGAPSAPRRDPADLLLQAKTLFDEADQALRDGDLGLYQKKVRAAQALIEQALDILAPESDGAAASG